MILSCCFSSTAAFRDGLITYDRLQAEVDATRVFVNFGLQWTDQTQQAGDTHSKEEARLPAQVEKRGCACNKMTNIMKLVAASQSERLKRKLETKAR